MKREPRPQLVRCSFCRNDVRALVDAHEIVIVVSPEKDGTLGGAYHVTRTGIWLCRRPCATVNPFDLAALTRLREHFSRAPPTTQQNSLLA